jgi:histidine triad (HIT) family protein
LQLKLDTDFKIITAVLEFSRIKFAKENQVYDQNNVFAKILKGEIPAKKIAEGEHFLSFHDIAAKAPVHALVIPKGRYINAHDFANQASSEEITNFWQGVSTTISALELDKNGYRLISNTGLDGRQEVPHFHIHILGGKDLGTKIV